MEDWERLIYFASATSVVALPTFDFDIQLRHFSFGSGTANATGTLQLDNTSIATEFGSSGFIPTIVAIGASYGASAVPYIIEEISVRITAGTKLYFACNGAGTFVLYYLRLPPI
jgi:hypothetical protein